LVARRFWGQGFGPETLRELSAFAKKALGYVSVYATVDIANSQSLSMLQSAGFCLYMSEHDEDGEYLVYHLLHISAHRGRRFRLNVDAISA